jgi:hypothetical protein
MRIPRSRGAVSGVLLVILGLFGALIPLVGPYFDFTIGNDSTWNFTDARIWLSVVPGVVAALCGLLLVRSANRATAGFGAWIALLCGAWFVVGNQVSQLWNDGTTWAGNAAGGTGQRVGEQLAFFDGVGVLIVMFAALALGRLAVRSVRDAELAAEAATEDDDDVIVAGTPRETDRFGRDREREPVGATAVTPATTATTTDNSATDRTDTLTAADRVRLAADDDADRGGLRGLLPRRR